MNHTGYIDGRFIAGEGAVFRVENPSDESTVADLTGVSPAQVAAAIAAARRGQGDMVAGHVIGSSLFNLLVVVGGMAALRPLPLPASFVKLELPAAIVFALMLYPMLRGDLRISKAEGGVLFVAFLGWVVLELSLLM